MKTTQSPMPGFFSINHGNQTQLIFAPAYNQEVFDKINKKYSWDDFQPYDNKYSKYYQYLLTPLYESAGVKSRADFEDFFNKLTRGQKLLDTFLTFDRQVMNGGVYQFLFNYPEYCFAALETLQELTQNALAKDYEKCLEEFLKEDENYAENRTAFNDDSLSWEERWAAFTAGYDDIPSGENIESYYYNDDYKKQLYKSVVDYIDSHFDQFVKKP